MQIAFHIGANCTDDDQLIKSVRKNASALELEGIHVPPIGRYRRLIRETVQSVEGSAPNPNVRQTLLDTIIDNPHHTDRLVLSNSAFLGVANRIFEGASLYQMAEAKLLALRQIFADDELDLYFAVRNPASFVPAAYMESKKATFGAYMHGMDPMDIRWSELVARIRSIVPDATLTVWANEDTPLIWAELIRDLSGVDPLTRITGGFDLLSSIMSKTGMQRFTSYLKSHPPQSEAQKRRIISAFLDKFAIEDEIDQEIPIPEWNDALIDELTDQYEDDLLTIQQMPNVRFIAP
jgi:hypothetical protein